MATAVEMPQLGNTVEECIITRWLRRTGEVVSAGDMIAEIETDKTTFEVTTPVDGTVLETFFEEGAVVPVFTPIFVVGEPGENVDEFRPGGGRADSPAPSQPALVRPERGPSGRVDQAAAMDAPETAPRTLEAAGQVGAPPLSPRASRFAAEHGFFPEGLIGSGPGGRVLERDLRHAYEGSASARFDSDALRRTSREPANARTANREPPAAARAIPPRSGEAGSGLRATIARRMRESLATTAQYTLHSSADATGLLAVRARIKESRTPDITINDLVTFCAIRALVDMPELNAEFVDSKVVTHSDVHIAFAVDTSRGLLAPVVRHAHTLPVVELARRMKDLAARAVNGTIGADDLTGATFTISNLGSLGIEAFTPLINPPQVAILGVDAIQLKPVRKHGQVSFVDAIGLSLTCDHQVIDGAPGARFLQLLREKIENVDTITEI